MRQQDIEQHLLIMMGAPCINVSREIRTVISEVAQKACHTKCRNKLSFAQNLLDDKVELVDNHFRVKE